MGKSKLDIRDVADKVDELIMNPANMLYWRSQVKIGLETYITDKELKDAIIDTDPDENIAAFYTILTFCHDDFLRMNIIINDEMKAINPQLCSYPQICAYMSGGFEQFLGICLRRVESDLGVINKEEKIVQPKGKMKQRGKKNVVDMFSFPTKEQVFFKDKDLQLPADRLVLILKKLIVNYDKVVIYKNLEVASVNSASEQLRGDIHKINKKLAKHKAPYKITALRTAGYSLHNTHQLFSHKKKL